MKTYTVTENTATGVISLVKTTAHTVLTQGVQGPPGAPIEEVAGAPVTSHATPQLRVTTGNPAVLYYYSPTNDEWKAIAYIP